ncbi:ornithine decarboxylase 2-like [Tetranychus urticae]|uniref:Orn/DAP/Arg decarboxylase 2 N-terminal domain-containing protein n=1 Tax=Tetranychus urticae TaxID=32264 RepID=T1JTK8_TETUR|nr:ornithine decarboxylase 2-like [Tetranychus urticae]
MPKLSKSICPKLLIPLKFWKYHSKSKIKSNMDKEFADFLVDVAASNIDSTTIIINVDEIVKKIVRWSEKMAEIDPFYFVQCNPHPLIISIMSAFNISFSCSSVAEIERVLSISEKSRIIISSLHKTQDLLKSSSKYNIEFLAADCDFELLKIKSMAPKANVLLRLQMPRKRSEKMGLESLPTTKDLKYGLFSRAQIDRMFHIAKESSIEITGVTFNVGTNCQDPELFDLAVDEAIKLFDIGLAKQVDMWLLNIGGGFPSTFISQSENDYFSKMSRVIEKAQRREKIKIIAEPGRYFVESSVWLMVRIIGKRVIESINGDQYCHYHVNESIFGLLSVYANRESLPPPHPFYDKQSPRNYVSTVIWGKNGSTDDLIMSDIVLPELVIGEYLAFQQCGAYLPHTNLTGLPNDKDSQPTAKYFASQKTQSILKNKGVIWSDLMKKLESYDWERKILLT